MMQDWSPDAMRFMRGAAARCDYRERLAGGLAPPLPRAGDGGGGGGGGGVRADRGAARAAASA